MNRKSPLFWLFIAVFAQFGISLPLSSDGIAGEGVDFERLYDIVLSEPMDHEYLYTEGKNTPLYEAMAVPNYYVGDLNDDSCDDLLLDYSDSLGIPQVVFGNKEKKFAPTTPFIGDARVRTIRRAQFVDINKDGKTDFVGFTAPHGFKEKELGKSWDGDEPEFVAINKNDNLFEVLDNNYETYSHAGFVADLDNDGTLEIMPLWESFNVSSNLLINKNKLKKGRMAFKRHLNRRVLDAAVGDLNDDGNLDIVLALGPKGFDDPNLQVTPLMSTEQKLLAVYFGDGSTDFSDLKPVYLGSHWMNEADWESYLDNRKTLGGFDSYAGPSNVNLLDIDGDSDLDIIVGQFVSAGFQWDTSGFKILKNSGGTFKDVTNSVVPNQDANRDFEFVNVGFIDTINLVDINKDGISDLLLTMRGSERNIHDGMMSMFVNVNGKYLPVSKSKSIGVEAFYPTSQIRSGDFNCDGMTDLVAITSAGHKKDAFKYYLARVNVEKEKLGLSPSDEQKKNDNNVVSQPQLSFKDALMKHNIQLKLSRDNPSINLRDNGSFEIASIEPLSEPFRYCCGENPVYRSRGRVDWSSGDLTESYSMNVHIFYSDEESKIVMEGRFMNTKHKFEHDFISEWSEIQEQCNPEMMAFTVTLNDRFGSRTSELACQIRNIKSDRVSRYFQSLVMYVNELEIPK